MARRPLHRWVALATALAVTSASLAATAGAAVGMPLEDSSACAAMTADVHQANNPGTGASIVSTFPGEVTAAGERYGFTRDLGVVFRAATAPADGLVPVHRLYHPRTGDFLWIAGEGGRDRAVSRYGYRFEHVDFYAAPEPVPCAVPVYRYQLGDLHRLAVSEADRDTLEAGGWRSEGVRFWAATPEPPVDDSRGPQAPVHGESDFTIAVLPDTQYEVFGGDRFGNRTRWLVRNREALGLEYVLHTGDVVSWDTPSHDQYERASAALRVLDDAGVPTALAVGNHDTAAVAVGGSAVPEGDTRTLVRDTATFNAYFPVDRYKPEGVFEPGRNDNNYQLFSAGGRDWMIVTLEMWPRPEAVAWAAGVVASHPERLVVVQTHSYLGTDGSVVTDRNYGATSPQYLHDHLITAYPNIRLVFSGHVGEAAYRVERGVHGNPIASFLGAFHSLRSNPVRLVRIDTASGTVSTQLVSPVDGRTWPEHDVVLRGMELG